MDALSPMFRPCFRSRTRHSAPAPFQAATSSSTGRSTSSAWLRFIISFAVSVTTPSRARAVRQTVPQGRRHLLARPPTAGAPLLSLKRAIFASSCPTPAWPLAAFSTGAISTIAPSRPPTHISATATAVRLRSNRGNSAKVRPAWPRAARGNASVGRRATRVGGRKRAPVIRALRWSKREPPSSFAVSPNR